MGDLKYNVEDGYITINECTTSWGGSPISLTVDKPVTSVAEKLAASYDIWKTANNMKEEKMNMKILDIYKRREYDLIIERYKITAEEIRQDDAFIKIHNKYVADIKKLYKKEYDEEMKFELELGSRFLTKETRDALKKNEEQKAFEKQNLEELLEEVRALLEMTDDFDKQIEILKKYEILNEDGMLNA